MTAPVCGYYSPNAILGSNGQPAPTTSVSVYPTGTTTAIALGTGPNTATGGAYPPVTDALGNLSFWAPPGLYDLWFTVGGIASGPITVEVLPYFTDLTTIIARAGTTSSTGPASSTTQQRITNLAFSSGFPNPAGSFTIPGGGDRMTATVAGFYEINAQVTGVWSASGQPELIIVKTSGGTNTNVSLVGVAPNGFYFGTANISDVVYLAVGDQVGLAVINPGTGNIPLNTAGTFFTAKFLSA